MLLLFVVLLSASVLADAARLEKRHYSPEDAEMHFEYFMNTYQKQYESETEKKLRFEIFKQNLEKINQKNNDPNQKYAVFGITSLTDLTQEEFKIMQAGLKPDYVPTDSSILHVDTSIAPPPSFDWRDHNAVTDAKNQKLCRSCWAFSTTGSVEGAYAIKHNQLLSFSEQQLVDCDKVDNGCNGGKMAIALEYLKNCSGIETEGDYPYQARDGTCTFDISKVKAKVTGYKSCGLSDDTSDETVMQLLQVGPISIGVDASSWDPHYHGEIFNCTYNKIDHGVLLVGYGTDDQGIPYWTIKNSWGPQWGDKGFIRVLRDGNSCGFKNDYAVIPEVE